MKKLLLVALLMLALVFTVVACQGNKNPDDTTAGTTAASDVTKAPEQPTQAPEQPTQAPEQPTEAPEQPTEAPEQPTEAPEQPTQAPEQPTEEPPVETEEPKPYKTAEEAGKTNASFDTFYVNNNMYFEQDGGAGDKLTAQDNIVAFKLGEAHDSMMIRGWIGFGQAIESFGYFMDDDTVFILDAANIKETEDGVKAAGGEFAVRFEIPVPLADLSDGNYTVGFVAKLADGTIVLLRECLTVSIEGLPWPEDAGKKNASFDTFYVNNNMYFEQDGGAGDKLAAQDNTIIFAYGDAHESMMLRGWIGFEQAIDTFGYFVDNGEYVFNADYTKPTEDPVKGAGGEFALRFEIAVPLAELTEGKHTVGFIVKLADGTIVRLRDYLKVVIQGIDAADITNKFTSDVASNEEGTDLKSSDLANYFTVMYGAGDPHSVSGGLYAYGGINEMYADVNGAYAYIVKMDESCDTAFAFVRGTHAVHSVDLTANGDGLFIINNYYETDGLGKMGAAGIYASIYDGKLNLMVKYYDDAVKNHVGNKYYSVSVAGNEVTMADNGNTVSILVDGQLIATIALSGETTYEKLDLVQPEVKFAQTAVVTLCDGTTETIENTLVASTYESQIGIALRPGTMKFSSLKVLGFSEVVIPDEFYTETEEPTPAGPVLINMDDERSTVTHISNDELRLIKADNTNDNAFAPGAFAGWDGVVTITEGQYIALCDWGWVGMKAETFKFGYILDNDLSVLYMFDEFTFATEQGVIDAAATTGATNASRFMGMLNTSLLPVGEHNVKFVMQQNGAEYVIIRDYKVVVNAAASEPVVENLVIDMSTLGGTGYRAEWGAAGYSAPLQLLGYGVTIDLGEIDLSKYSAVKITYSSDGSENPTKLNYEASSSLAIGLKNENSSYGQATDDNFNGDIAHTNMVFSNKGWAGGARDAIVDLSEVTYSGHVWLAVHNPAGTEIAISAIEFIA